MVVFSGTSLCVCVCIYIYIYTHTYVYKGPGSVVGIATVYGLDGGGSNLGGSKFSAPVRTDPEAHPASCTMGTGSFPGGKVLPGRNADPSTPSNAEV